MNQTAANRVSDAIARLDRKPTAPAEPTYENTYWNHKGKHEEMAKALRALIPAAGEVPYANLVPALERYRIAGNCYYDLYNNGLCNRGQEFAEVFDISGLYGDEVELTQELIDRTESKMDEIILAAYAEQFPPKKATRAKELPFYETAKRFRDAVAQIDFSSIPGAYDSIPWADMDQVLSEN